MRASTVRTLAALALSAALASACGGGQDPAELAAQQAAAREQAAEQAARQFEAAVAEGNWALARAQGDVLLADYPGTAAAGRIAAQHAEARAKAAQEAEDYRLASLWSYQQLQVEGGQQRSASIAAKDPVDVDGSGAKPVQLIFREHPEWGRSSYLVLKAGDFDCYGGCRVQVTIDGEPRRMAASRPRTDDAIAMFVEDERALWRLAAEGQVIAIEFPVAAGGTRTATFEVGGLEPSKMPGW
ncbi:MAG: hypothetical protein ACLGHW_07255 [Gammaproteobacteria bacterium]